MPPPQSSIAKGIIWHKVQPRERPFTSHLVFQSHTFVSTSRKHAPVFLLHNMFTRVDCRITATSSSLYLNHIPPLLVDSQRHWLIRQCISYAYIIFYINLVYIHIELLQTKVADNKGRLKYCFCACSFSHRLGMIISGSIRAWWISPSCQKPKRTTICRCQLKLWSTLHSMDWFSSRYFGFWRRKSAGERSQKEEQKDSLQAKRFLRLFWSVLMSINYEDHMHVDRGINPS